MAGRSSARPDLPTNRLVPGRQSGRPCGRACGTRRCPSARTRRASRKSAHAPDRRVGRRHSPPTSISSSGRPRRSSTAHRSHCSGLRPATLAVAVRCHWHGRWCGRWRDRWPLQHRLRLSCRRRPARSASAASAGRSSPGRRPPSSPPGCRPPRSSSARSAAGPARNGSARRSFRIRFVLLRTATTGMPCSTAASVGKPTQPSGITRAETSSAVSIDGSYTPVGLDEHLRRPVEALQHAEQVGGRDDLGGLPRLDDAPALGPQRFAAHRRRVGRRNIEHRAKRGA